MQTKLITTKNECWGFYGATLSNLGLSDDEAAKVFDRAVRFTAKRLNMNLDAARRFLDSKLGRHLGDQCNHAAGVEIKLGALYASWKRDVTSFRAMAINTTDEAFYC